MKSPKFTHWPNSSSHKLHTPHLARRSFMMAATLLLMAVGALAWQEKSAAAERTAIAQLSHLLGRVSPALPAALSLSPVSVDGSASLRTTISTIAGGGLG